MVFRLFSQKDASGDYRFDMTGNTGEYDVRTDVYDMLVTHSDHFIKDSERLRTSVIELPVENNDAGEPVITDGTADMLYAGYLDSVLVDYNRRYDYHIDMMPMMRKINFKIYITDEFELEGSEVDLSGIAYRMTVWNRECDQRANGVVRMALTKEGRFLSGQQVMTLFTGSFHCLGTVGQNILYFSYTDAEGKVCSGEFDLSPMLKGWQSQSTEVIIRLFNNKGELDMESWEEGDSEDITIIN